MRLMVSMLTLAFLAACAVPYQPEPVRHLVPLPADALERVTEAVRDHYKHLEHVDAEHFRVQSKWSPFQRGDLPGFRRASVYRDEQGQLQVIVEIYFLEMHANGIDKSEVRGDRRAEQALAAAIERSLGQ